MNHGFLSWFPLWVLQVSRWRSITMTKPAVLKLQLMENPAFRAEYEKACVEYQAAEGELVASASSQSRKTAAGSDRSVPDKSQ
jgi:hypothetical protein